jgi:hypothetical protein
MKVDFMALQTNFQASQSAMQSFSHRMFSEKLLLQAEFKPMFKLMCRDKTHKPTKTGKVQSTQ